MSITPGVITRVRLTNWKSHASSELEFLPGTNVLIGVMGAGKSAVLDAISFALFGTFPSLNSKKLSIDGCITNKPEQKSRAVVEVFFTIGEGDYSILREIVLGKGTTRSELRLREKLIEGPQTKRVTEEAVKLLGMDYDLFSRAVYSEQNQLDYFLQIPSGQRKKKIDELLRIDRFEEARRNASALVRQFTSETMALKQQLAGISVPDIKKEEDELREMEKKMEESRSGVRGVRVQLSSLEEKYSKMEDAQKKTERLQQESSSLRSKLEIYTKSEAELKKELEGVGDITEEMQLKKERLHRLSMATEPKAAKELADAEKRVALLEEKLRAMDEKNAERGALLKKKEELEGEHWGEKLAAAKREREKLIEKRKECELLISNAEKRLRELSAAGDRCPVCESEITDEKRGELEGGAKKVVSESQEHIKTISEQLAGIRLDEMERNIRELEGINARIKGLELSDEISGLRLKLQEEKLRLKELEARAKEERETIGRLQREREILAVRLKELELMLKKQDKLAAAAREHALLIGRKRELEKELSVLHFNAAEFHALREKIKALSTRRGELESLAKSSEKIVGEKRRLIDEMKERVKGIAMLKARSERLADAAEKMGIFKKSIENTQVQLREQFIASVNLGLDDIWRKLYPYGDYPRLQLSVEGGDYTLRVLTLQGEWVNIEGFASGGERSTAALALRIAFSMVLAPHLSWLVLDEPTHNLDLNGIARLSETMRSHLPEIVNQIFLITHDEGMERAATGNFYRLERKKSEDGPTKALLISSGKD